MQLQAIRKHQELISATAQDTETLGWWWKAVVLFVVGDDGTSKSRIQDEWKSIIKISKKFFPQEVFGFVAIVLFYFSFSVSNSKWALYRKSLHVSDDTSRRYFSE